MKAQTEIQLIEQLSEFVGKKLKHFKLKEDIVDGKNVLLLALVFSSNGESIPLILSLDKKATLKSYKNIGEKL